MNNKKIIILLLMLFAMVANAQTRGAVDRDIDFKTYTGDEYNLHDLLKSGKYVYVITYKYPF